MSNDAEPQNTLPGRSRSTNSKAAEGVTTTALPCLGIAATAAIIAIYAELVASLVVERKKHLRLVANVPEGAAVDLALVKSPKGALMFPNPPAPGESFSLTSLRNPRNTTKEFVRKGNRARASRPPTRSPP